MTKYVLKASCIVMLALLVSCDSGYDYSRYNTELIYVDKASKTHIFSIIKHETGNIRVPLLQHSAAGRNKRFSYYLVNVVMQDFGEYHLSVLPLSINLKEELSDPGVDSLFRRISEPKLDPLIEKYWAGYNRMDTLSSEFNTLRYKLEDNGFTTSRYFVNGYSMTYTRDKKVNNDTLYLYQYHRPDLAPIKQVVDWEVMLDVVSVDGKLSLISTDRESCDSLFVSDLPEHRGEKPVRSVRYSLPPIPEDLKFCKWRFDDTKRFTFDKKGNYDVFWLKSFYGFEVTKEFEIIRINNRHYEYYVIPVSSIEAKITALEKSVMD